MPGKKSRNKERKVPNYYLASDSSSLVEIKTYIDSEGGRSFGDPSLLKEMEDYLETCGHKRLIPAEAFSLNPYPEPLDKPEDGSEK